MRAQISQLGFVGNLSKEFLDKHSEIKGRIDALKAQNEAYLTLTDLQDARKKADEMLNAPSRISLPTSSVPSTTR